MTVDEMVSVGWRIYANRNPWDVSVGLWFVSHEAPSYKPALITNVTVEVQEEGFSMPPRPTMSLHQNTLQAFVNNLWELGIRPVQAKQGPEAGVVDHLRDMRAIAFHKLGIQHD